MAYNSTAMAGEAATLRFNQEMVDEATAKLQAVRLEPVIFGLTPGAGGFSASVTAARSAQARGFRAEGERAGTLAAGADSAAVAGNGLTARSATIASGS